MDLVILDRDGVINYDSPEFIKSPSEWRAIPGSLQSIAALTAAGVRVAIATNQSGVGRGLFDSADLTAIHTHMVEEIEAAGGAIDMIAVCPHAPDEGCQCRKPRSGLLTQIAERFQQSIPLSGVPVIGDSCRDIVAARSLGARAILVLTGNGSSTAAELEDDSSLEIFANLSDAVDNLLGEDKP
ncbi:MAG: D-glycero-beta-D-manno-heptose 1,7-bisphosphate 7-phosphatase [Gammaproteobacteria bacterium]